MTKAGSRCPWLGVAFWSWCFRKPDATRPIIPSSNLRTLPKLCSLNPL